MTEKDSGKLFEDIKKVIKGVEYWDARELMGIVGYQTWAKFETAISKAKTSVTKFGINADIHFLPAPAKSTGGRPGLNYLLTRTACYYIFQNGDPRKQEIANAQAYFIVQTYRQEKQDRIGLDTRRVNLRDRVRSSTESLSEHVTMVHDVTNLESFHEAGNFGLYNLPTSEVEAMKGIEEGRLLDNIDSAELAAQFFRTTQTEISMENDAVTGHVYDQEGAESVAQSVGLKVRSLMRETGRTLPEDLPAAEDIEQVIERVSEHEKQFIEPPLKESKRRIQEGPKDATSPEQISLLD